MDVSVVTDRQEEVVARLTKRELEVLFHKYEGKSSLEVALALYVSKRTIDFHLARIYEKLQVSNCVQALRRATHLGLFPVNKTPPAALAAA